MKNFKSGHTNKKLALNKNPTLNLIRIKSKSTRWRHVLELQRKMNRHKLFSCGRINDSPEFALNLFTSEKTHLKNMLKASPYKIHRKYIHKKFQKAKLVNFLAKKRQKFKIPQS